MASIQDRIGQDIERVGWHVVKVMEGGDDEPPFAYTVGLTRSYGHPELVVIGLDLDGMGWMLNVLGEGIRNGRTFEAGEESDDLLEVATCRLAAVDRRWYDEYFGQAQEYYGDDSFDVLQLMWPDPDGHFPNDPEFDADLRAEQPLLA